jgi:hypothetical protein
MKRVIGILLLLSFSVIGAITEKEVKYNYEILENQFLKLEFLPNSFGRLDQIYVKLANRDLLLRRFLTKVSVDPLYEFYRNNTFGCGENFWKNYVAKRDGKSKVFRQGSQIIIFESKWYGALAIDVTRKVYLGSNETFFTFEAEFFNKDIKKDFYLAPWYSLFPKDSNSTFLIIPAAGGMNTHPLGNVKIFPKDNLAENPLGLVAPSRNWVATVYSKEKIILAMILPKEEVLPNGAFYSWHGTNRNIGYRSMEGILAGSTLKSKTKRKVRCIFAVFLGLNNIKDIAGTTAIDVIVAEKKLSIKLAASKKLYAGKMTVKVVYEKLLKSYTVNIPEIMPGKTYNFALDLEDDKVKKIVGTLPDNSTFDLLGF